MIGAAVHPAWPPGWGRPPRSPGEAEWFRALLFAAAGDPVGGGSAPDAARAPGPDPDRELLDRVLAEYPHGTAAFAELMERHWRRAWNLSQSVLLHEQEAEEATQDVFLKVHRYLPSFRGESRFTTWLSRIARNTALSRLAAIRRRRDTRRRVERDVWLKEAWSPWRPPRPGSGTSAVRQALESLEDEDRAVLVQHVLEGVPYEEIAEAFEMTAGAVRMRAMRARQRLRAALETLREAETRLLKK